MHNLALALRERGYQVTGSDDEIFEPSRSRLEKARLLPENEGWYPQKITASIDAVILGMHAKNDNPELIRARELDLPIYSYPDFLYEQSKNKIRIVIGGSHGKTTITAMILHVLKNTGIDADFMVGAQLDGFDVMVRLSETAEYVVMEGDEYLASALDPRPKFHIYKPHIALLSGIAWDHINVFPTFENYTDQFRIFIDKIEKDGLLIYSSDDPVVRKVVDESRQDINKIGYSIPEHRIHEGITRLLYNGKTFPLRIFGKHNLYNLNGAMEVCRAMGVSPESFLESIQSFQGASRRLEIIRESFSSIIYRDFAHSPSKLKATVQSVREQFPDRKLVACIELHTYSSLSEKFLKEYSNSMHYADIPVVFFNPHALELKGLPPTGSRSYHRRI